MIGLEVRVVKNKVSQCFRRAALARTRLRRKNQLVEIICCKIPWRRGLGNVCGKRTGVFQFGGAWRFLRISRNIQAGEGLGHGKSKIFFAGANFIALRRRGSYSKWFVETIPSLYRGSYKQSFSSPGRRSEILDEKNKSRVMTRFGS